MLKNDLYWREALNEHFVSLTPRFESTPERQKYLKAFGTLIMASIFHGISPDPVSPFLLALIFQGSSALTDQDFITSVAPSTAEDLCEWPSDDAAIPKTPRNSLLLAGMELQVRVPCYHRDRYGLMRLQHRDIQDHTPDQLRRLRLSIFREKLIGKVNESEVAAINDGLRIKPSATLKDISSVSSSWICRRLVK